MFLRWVGLIGLLQPEDDTHILQHFSYTVKRAVVSEVVNHLNDPETSPKILTTPAHVKFIMEIIGAGFTLNIEDVAIMDKCVHLYGLNLNDQYFFQRIFYQMSFLFEPRLKEEPPNSPAAINQVRICKDVLDNIYLQASHKLAKVVTKETWEHWLRLLLGVCDSIFRNKGSAGLGAQGFLIKSLGPPATLFEVWMLAKTEDVDLWKAMLDLMPTWVIVPTVWHWNTVCLGLTNRTLALMYGTAYGTDSCYFEWQIEEKVTAKAVINLPTEFTFYAWQRFLHLLPNPNTYTDPDVYRTAWVGIARLVDTYLNLAEAFKKDVSMKQRSKVPPSGNTILSIFGRWLIESVIADRPGYEEGTSIAIGALCRIFCRAFENERGFLTVHLASLYSALAKILQKDVNDKVICTALLNCRTLFLRELKGSHALIPYFFYAFSRVWSQKPPDPPIRAACIDIIGSLVCLGDHYMDAALVSKLAKDVVYPEPFHNLPYPTKLEACTQLKPHLQLLLSRALAKEDSARNIQRILWCIVALLQQMENRDIRGPEELDIRFAAFVFNEIVRNARKRWSAEVLMVAYSAISALTAIYQYFGASRRDLAKSIVTGLAENVIDSCNKNCQEWEKEENDKLIQRLLVTLTDWIMVDPDFTAGVESSVFSVILRAITTALGGQIAHTTKPVSLSAGVKTAAHFALSCLLSRSANFPQPNGPHKVSSEINEPDVLNQITPDAEMKQQYVRYFVLDGQCVLTLIDVPTQDNNPTVVCIVRDAMGKHVWTTRARYYEDNDPLNPLYDPTNHLPITTTPLNLQKFETNVVDQMYTELLEYLPVVWQGRYYNGCLTSFTETFARAENEHLASTSYGLNKDVKMQVPAAKNPYDGDCKWVHSRILLSHLGLLHPDNSSRLQWVEYMKPGFTESLAALDGIGEREAVSVGVILLANQPARKFDFLVGENWPLDYQEFLSAIGWAVNLWEHTGYRGGLVPSKSGDFAPYYANYSTEVIFEVCTWMPNDKFPNLDKAIQFKKRVISKNNVFVVWNLLEDYEPQLISGLQKDAVQIVITPLKSGLYHVRVFKDNKPFLLGPIMDTMILSKRLLGELVRRTAIFAHRVATQDKSIVTPMVSRKAKIEEFAKEFCRSYAYDDFLTVLFTKKAPYTPPAVQPAPVLSPSFTGPSLAPATLSAEPPSSPARANLPKTPTQSPSSPFAPPPVSVPPATMPQSHPPQSHPPQSQPPVVVHQPAANLAPAQPMPVVGHPPTVNVVPAATPKANPALPKTAPPKVAVAPAQPLPAGGVKVPVVPSGTTPTLPAGVAPKTGVKVAILPPGTTPAVNAPKLPANFPKVPAGGAPKQLPQLPAKK